MGQKATVSNGRTMEAKKAKAEILLNIANLILTAVIGIGLALFFKFRDENFQTNIVKLQAEVQRQSELAHISAGTTCFYRYYCGGAVFVKNSGPANAENLRITFSLSDIHNSWKDTIKNIDVFNIKIDPVSIQPKITNAMLGLKYGIDTRDGNNTINVLIDTLPTNKTVEFFISLDENKISTVNQTETRYYIISNTSGKDFDTNEWRELISNYQERRFEIASFNVDFTCDNCEGDIPQESIYDSADNGWGMSELEKITEAGKEAFRTKVTSHHLVPSNVTLTPSPNDMTFGVDIPITNSPLYLTLSEQPGRYEINENFP